MQYYKCFPPPHAPSIVLFACSSFESREKGAICCCYLLSMIQSDGEAFRRNIAKLANVACRRWMLVSLAARLHVMANICGAVASDLFADGLDFCLSVATVPHLFGQHCIPTHLVLCSRYGRFPYVAFVCSFRHNTSKCHE